MTYPKYQSTLQTHWTETHQELLITVHLCQFKLSENTEQPLSVVSTQIDNCQAEHALQLQPIDMLARKAFF